MSENDGMIECPECGSIAVVDNSVATPDAGDVNMDCLNCGWHVYNVLY